MAKKPAGPRIATANRLHDGRVVFLRADGEWSMALNEADIARDDNAAAILEERARAHLETNQVVDVYLVEVEERDGAGMTPVENRERLRNLGPTVGHSLERDRAGDAARQAA